MCLAGMDVALVQGGVRGTVTYTLDHKDKETAPVRTPCSSFMWSAWWLSQELLFSTSSSTDLDTDLNLDFDIFMLW